MQFVRAIFAPPHGLVHRDDCHPCEVTCLQLAGTPEPQRHLCVEPEKYSDILGVLVQQLILFNAQAGQNTRGAVVQRLGQSVADVQHDSCEERQ